MEEKQKKLLICLLLLISCLTSTFILIYAPAEPSPRLTGYEQADSLIVAGFTDFGIPQAHMSVKLTAVDSLLTRSTYFISVPPEFSKVQFHLELSQAVSPFSISTPANVIFPERNMIIHLVFHQTVIRTLVLETDPDLAMQQDDNQDISNSES